WYGWRSCVEAPGGCGILPWQDEMEGSTVAGFGLGPDPAAVARQDAAHAGQADAGARVLAGLVQALEHPEQLAGVGHVEADAVVADGEMVAAVGGGLVAHLDDRRFAVGR